MELSTDAADARRLATERRHLFVLFVLFIYPLMYYVVVSDVRYRLPVLWLSLLPAGYFLTYSAQRVLNRSRRTT